MLTLSPQTKRERKRHKQDTDLICDPIFVIARSLGFPEHVTAVRTL